MNLMIHLAKFKFPPNLEPQNVDQPVNTPASATGSNAASQALPDTKDRWQYLRVSLAVFVIAFAYLYRLDRPLLWIDEAQTGIAARNILHHGHPTAFDGRNAALCDNGRTLDTNLLFKQLPWFRSSSARPQRRSLATTPPARARCLPLRACLPSSLFTPS